MKAHQRLIREKIANSPPLDLFGEWWKYLNLSLQDTEIREIDYPTAEKIILEYEWLGTMPPFVHKMFGIFFDGYCGGALVFSQRTEKNLAGVKESFIPEDALYLSRGACTHWTPKNTASYFISRVCRSLGNISVLAYADVTAGEIGQIYQALNWHCFPPGKGGPTGYKVGEKIFCGRELQRIQKTRGKPTEDSVPILRKTRYVGVYGDRRWKRRMDERLRPHAIRYLRRAR